MCVTDAHPPFDYFNAAKQFTQQLFLSSWLKLLNNSKEAKLKNPFAEPLLPHSGIEYLTTFPF